MPVRRFDLQAESAWIPMMTEWTLDLRNMGQGEFRMVGDVNSEAPPLAVRLMLASRAVVTGVGRHLSGR